MRVTLHTNTLTQHLFVYLFIWVCLSMKGPPPLLFEKIPKKELFINVIFHVLFILDLTNLAVARF